MGPNAAIIAPSVYFGGKDLIFCPLRPTCRISTSCLVRCDDDDDLSGNTLELFDRVIKENFSAFS